MSLAACQQVQSQPNRPAPLPQDSLVQAYFNHEPSAEYTEPYRQQTRPGDDLEQIIIDAIASAESTVDVAVQELRLPRIAQALIDRQKAGVKVRVILENNYSRPWSQISPTALAKLPARERDRLEEYRQLADRNRDGQLSASEIAQGDTLVMLNQANLPWIDDTANGSAGSDLMHHKFVVIDGQALIVTSANFTTSDIHGDFARPSSQGNANNLLKISSPQLAQVFAQEFNEMWGDGPGGKPDSKFGLQKSFRGSQTVQVGDIPITVQFSPTSSTRPWSRSTNGLISKTLATAQQSVDLALFVFSEQRLADGLASDRQRGVQIRALIDPSFAYRPYSEGLDLLGVELPDNCRVEANNRPWANPIKTVGVPRLPPGDLLHNKFGVVDQRVVITGSHNWSEAANTGNDETLLVINSPIVAAHYIREFERLNASAILGLPPAVQRKIEAQQQQCKTIIRQDSNKGDRNSPVSSQVNLNTATQAELETLPNVGPALAKRIIAARQQQPFKSLQDLDRVAGVGPQLLYKLEPYVTW